MESATSAYVQAALVLLLLLGIILLGGWAARRFGLPGAMTGMRRGGRPHRRLRVREILPLDARRRLVLVARDDVEHLLLIGGQGADQVVERAIVPPRFTLPEAPPAVPSPASRGDGGPDAAETTATEARP